MEHPLTSRDFGLRRCCTLHAARLVGQLYYGATDTVVIRDYATNLPPSTAIPGGVSCSVATLESLWHLFWRVSPLEMAVACYVAGREQSQVVLLDRRSAGRPPYDAMTTILDWLKSR